MIPPLKPVASPFLKVTQKVPSLQKNLKVLMQQCTERKRELEQYFGKNKGKIELAGGMKKLVVINKRNAKLVSQSVTADMFHKAKL